MLIISIVFVLPPFPPFVPARLLKIRGGLFGKLDIEQRLVRRQIKITLMIASVRLIHVN